MHGRIVASHGSQESLISPFAFKGICLLQPLRVGNNIGLCIVSEQIKPTGCLAPENGIEAVTRPGDLDGNNSVVGCA